jgi:hypothetical protein
MSQPTRAEVAVLLKKAAGHRRRIRELHAELELVLQKVDRVGKKSERRKATLRKAK